MPSGSSHDSGGYLACWLPLHPLPHGDLLHWFGWVPIPGYQACVLSPVSLTYNHRDHLFNFFHSSYSSRYFLYDAMTSGVPVSTILSQNGIDRSSILSFCSWSLTSLLPRLCSWRTVQKLPLIVHMPLPFLLSLLDKISWLPSVSIPSFWRSSW